MKRMSLKFKLVVAVLGLLFSNLIAAKAGAQEIGHDGICPSITEDLTGEAMQRDAFFETTDFYIFICRDSADVLYYYGVSKSRQDPNNYILLPIESVQIEYMARNGDTVYQINSTELNVSQAEQTLLTQSVIQHLDGSEQSSSQSILLPSLEATQWQLASYQGEAVLEDVLITAQFQDGRLTGSSGCNRYTATYTATENQLILGPLATTRKLCAEPTMMQEQTYLSLLAQVTAYRATASSLELRTSEGSLLLISN
ncbi:MAG: META domain-containing protein [Leptolyngbya sp. SIO3F4]|nr:META domain-containing protein [Leptolyngbya sp. SIO3F4]